ncbi:hypothetical protein CMK11_05610 [Candidatus Poribacteria bacterium]|nr:hypothetical protein [Candidatus Poribacteria bacterium]
MKSHRTLCLSAAACVLALIAFAFTQPGTHARADENTDATIVNGVDVTVLSGLVDALEAFPQGGFVTFFSDTEWQHGMRSFTSFTGYRIHGQMHHQNERQFVLLGDAAAELGGTDAAPAAVEELMYAMGTCITAMANVNAAFMGVRLTQFEVALECDIKMHGLFGLNPEVRPGIIDGRATITIAGDADEDTLTKIAMAGYDFSPVSDSVRNGVKMTPKIVVR